MQAQSLRRFFAPASIILALAAATFLAPLAATAANAFGVPEVRCQAFDAPIPGFDYRRAPSTFGESQFTRHIVTTGVNNENQRLHAWTTLEPLPSGQEDPFEVIIRDLDAAWRGAGLTPPPITDRGPTPAEINALDIPDVLKTALWECDLAIVYFVSNIERRSIGGRIPSGNEVTSQGVRAEDAAREARRTLAPEPGNNSSSSGGTIAAIGGAALIAGGLTWLLWPDAKQTIQPYVQGGNDGRGYATGLQISAGKSQTFTLTQTDGPRKNRHTQIRWSLQW